jgi:transcriptional regulator with XRE-family HTH domain
MKMPKDAAWRKMVGRRLEQSLIAIGKKPAEIARLFGISQQRLSNYITGARPLDIEVAMKLSARFGITLDWLYMGDIRSLPYEIAQRIVPIEEGTAH